MPCYKFHNWRTLWIPALRTGAVFACGDLFTQVFLYQIHFCHFNKKRTATYFLVGAVIGATLPLVKNFEDKLISNGLYKRIIVDQIIFVPFCLLFCLLTAGFIENQDHQSVNAYLNRHYYQLLKSSYIFWPLFSIFALYAVKSPYQCVTLDCGFFVFGAYLSWYFNRCKCGCLS